MFCECCGKYIHEGALFCPYCGAVRVNEGKGKKKGKNKKQQEAVAYMPPMAYQNTPAYPTQPEQEEKDNDFAIAGFIASFISPVLGWVLGGLGLWRAKKRNGKGKWFAIAAFVIATLKYITARFVHYF